MTNRGGQDDVQRVRQATDLVGLIGEHVALRQRGREHLGLCPFHDDSNPSFAVVVHKGDPFYKCHACGAAGDCFNFVMDYHKMEFAAALRFLAERAGIELERRKPGGQSGSTGTSPRAALMNANVLAEQYFMQMLRSDRGAAARAELAKRGYGPEIIEQFHIGAAPAGWDGLLQHLEQRREDPRHALTAGLLKQRDNASGFYDSFRNRLIFPIHDELGRPIAFGGRRLDPEEDPKYLNSAESPVFDKSGTLFALAQAKRSILDSATAVVTEGYTDVITCHQHGFTNVVATLGTALTPKHARVLSRLCDTVILLFDGDAAGQKAADRAIEVFFSGRLDVRICVLPNGTDPDDLLREADGRSQFAAAIEAAQDALEYKIGRVREELRDVATLSARQTRIDRTISDLARLGFGAVQGVRKAMVIQQIAETLRVSTDDITQAFAKVTTSRPRRDTTPESNTPNTAATPADTRCRAERELLGLIIADPQLLSTQLASSEGEQGATVLQFVRSLRFVDETSARIAERVFELHDAGQLIGSALLHGLDHATRSVAADLMTRTAMSDASAEGGEQTIVQVCQTLQNMMERERFELDVAQLRDADDPSGDQLSDLISRRRQQEFVGNRMPRVRL